MARRGQKKRGVGRPRGIRYETTVLLRMSGEMHAQLKSRAASEARPLAWLIRDALATALRKSA